MNECFPVLKEDEVARMLLISERTLRRLRMEGKGPPFVKVGGSVRYVRLSVEEWLSNNEKVVEAADEILAAAERKMRGGLNER